MEITVHYTTQLKAAVGVGSEQFDVADDCRLSDLVTALSERHPEPFSQLVVDDSGQLLPSILVAVGDNQVAHGDDPQLTGDAVTFLSAISGG